MSVQQYRGHANSQPLIMQLFQVNLFKQVTTDMFTDSKHPEIQREIADGNQDAGNQKKAVCQKNLTWNYLKYACNINRVVEKGMSAQETFVLESLENHEE